MKQPVKLYVNIGAWEHLKLYSHNETANQISRQSEQGNLFSKGISDVTGQNTAKLMTSYCRQKLFVRPYTAQMKQHTNLKSIGDA